MPPPLKTPKITSIIRPAFVVHCSTCDKVQAAAVAEDASDRETKKVTGWLRSAARRNKTFARQLATDERLPDAQQWCNCKPKPSKDEGIRSLKFSEADYIQFDPCEGDEGQVNCRTVRLVRARTSHACFLGAAPFADQHLIQAGDVYRSERALIDGDYWGTYKVCVPCMDKYLTELGLRPRQAAR